ncbi:sodium:proton antiporter [Teredinibacter purpureus]|uniref:sodium:proton antiporter n=1 Tax=Teredinibacter purpureus TaxID=2731756 RepID=UPI000A72DF35|nr:sodium:proton antiporter [Teredinibacter purpureus]
MIFDHDELARAVLFFNDAGAIVKEMHYTEFEAILDNYVPSIDWAGQTAKSVCIDLDSKLRIRTAIFFTIGFNAKGEVDSTWNIPLDQLIGSAIRGPDLGAGPIRLVCASQCPIQYFKDSLWDPDMRSGKNHLSILSKAALRNKLSIQFREGPHEPAQAGSPPILNNELLEQKISGELRKEYASEFRNQTAQLLKDQRLRAATISNESKKSIASLKVDYSNRIEEYRTIIAEKNRTIEEERERNQALKETIDGQAMKIEGLREYFEHKLEKAEGQGAEHIHSLRDNHQAEIEAKITVATTELNEMLQMREVELMYRNEQERQLRDEISRLRKENEALMGNTNEGLLSKMVGKGISFVSYQPGAGHITIPFADIADYMTNSVAYAAAQCGVKEALYKAWLDHYQAPVCSAIDENGSICGENVPRITNPTDFHSGDEDRCSAHKEIKSAGSLKVVSG